MEGSDNDFSHVTQTGFFYTIKGTKQDTVLFCGDRWADFAGNGLGYNQWVPLTVDGDKVKFNSFSEFHLNAKTGEWRVGEKNNYILNPSFNADRVIQSTMAGWKNSGPGISNIQGGRTGFFCMTQYSDQDFKSTLYQDINLPNGIYTFKGYAKGGGEFNEVNFYVKGGAEDKTVSLKSVKGDWKEFTITDIKITNGKCQVGVYTDGKANAWIRADDLSLVAQ